MVKFEGLMFKSMKKIFFVVCTGLFVSVSFGQTVSQNLQKAWQQFESDSQLKHAISSLYVIDAKTGQVVFDKNSQIGLAPASTQKIITAATAFELLGSNYRYKTFFKLLRGDLCVAGGGDPTLGSTRYKSTSEPEIFNEIMSQLDYLGVNAISNVVMYGNEEYKKIPSGWIFEDIGNYYGASPAQFNWKENQYDITFIPGKKEGDQTAIDTTNTYNWKYLINNCLTGKQGSGDNAYVYFIPENHKLVITGTVPAGVNRFTIAASDNFPGFRFASSFQNFVISKGMYRGDTTLVTFKSMSSILDSTIIKKPNFIHYSPSLDSISYWFLKKSINLYGEALIKTFAYEKNGFGTTDGGVKIVKDFWKQKGIDEDELNISDGSGLSPQNRVTTHAQVEILKYAKSRDWFQYYLNGFPDYNGMTMKSGTIRDVKGFAGYHKAKDGKEYIFSFLVNNYNGRTSGVVSKMYKVLDELK